MADYDTVKNSPERLSLGVMLDMKICGKDKYVSTSIP